MNVGVRNIKSKPLTVEDLYEMHRIATVNARYLNATIHHLLGMVNTLTGKKDEPLRNSYRNKVEKAKKKLEEEKFWLSSYAKTINKYNEQHKKSDS